MTTATVVIIIIITLILTGLAHKKQSVLLDVPFGHFSQHANDLLSWK